MRNNAFVFVIIKIQGYSIAWVVINPFHNGSLVSYPTLRAHNVSETLAEINVLKDGHNCLYMLTRNRKPIANKEKI